MAQIKSMYFDKDTRIFKMMQDLDDDVHDGDYPYVTINFRFNLDN